MGLFDWFTDRGRKTEPRPTPVPNPAAATSMRTASPLAPAVARPAAAAAPATDAQGRVMAAGGLDFVSAIQAHQNWKTRLGNYLRNESDEKLDYRVICRDDQCALGKWINGDAAVRFGHLPSFGELKVTHGLFHLTAGRIVQLHGEQKTDDALIQLRQGDYPRHSIKVMGLLSALYQEVAAQDAPVAQA